jgi:glycine/D-amino acid oxidase-like deaminating enzyme
MMHDVVIIGGGHNGLVCSAYLAMAGLKVLVLDQRPVAGGAAVTEEFSPGFRNSVASYAVSLLNPKIIRDLDLAVHGLRIVDRPVSNFLPLGDGSFLKVGGGHTKREVAKFSARDADRLDDSGIDAADTGVHPLPRMLGGKAFGRRARGAAQKAQWTAGDVRENPIGDFGVKVGQSLFGDSRFFPKNSFRVGQTDAFARLLRAAAFKGLRDDKSAEEIVLEAPATAVAPRSFRR